ncbi:MAG: hypothetical protein MET45_20990 [Nostoc sp. LLA-1]|nr:hypothetical protein [Cyanocohniella sp. LLY]
MKLNARKKEQPLNKEQPLLPNSTPLPSQNEPQLNEVNYIHNISLQCNTLLYITLQNMISSQHTANDFTYSSVTDVIRSALDAYKDGMELTELDEHGERKQISLRVTKEQHKFYRSLPNQLRRKLVERAIRTFIKNQ